MDKYYTEKKREEKSRHWSEWVEVGAYDQRTIMGTKIYK